MTPDEIGFELRALYKSRSELVNIYKRKRAWRDSEKAMACAGVHRQMEAIRLAYESVTGRQFK